MITTTASLANSLAPALMGLEEINSTAGFHLNACVSVLDKDSIKLTVGIEDRRSENWRFEKSKYRELGSYLIQNADIKDVCDRIKEIFLDLGLKLFPSDVSPSV